ncbi:MAG: S8/S53 family peptidase [Gemmatimonadaceae bacterium]
MILHRKILGHLRLLMGASSLVLIACTDEPVAPARTNAPPAASIVSSNSQRDGLVHWNDVSDGALWKELAKSGRYAQVGLKRRDQRHGMANGRVLLSRDEWAQARAAVGQVGDVSLASADTLLPHLRVRVGSVEALHALRTHPNVSFVEPGSFVDRSRETLWMTLESGCSVGGYAGPTGNTIISPGDVVPWNYNRMNIPAAWARAPGGSGVTVGIVDTGLDFYQPELNQDFATGMSTGRTFTKDAASYAKGPYIWQDDCGHGTRMASVIGSPRNGKAILGVAWAANLYTVRVDDDVYLSNVSATRDGIRWAAQHAKIVAMAFGTIGFYQTISDELSYWYANDKLLLAAAGTSACWDPLRNVVTFPGTEPTVTTVTALDQTGAIACNAHYGLAVDFAAYADQPVSGLGRLGNQLAGFAGSSDAVGVLAGLAALALSIHPTYTRDQLLTSLSYAASPTGYRSPFTGWGSPNALCVVDAVCATGISGTDLVQTYGTRTYSWTAWQAAAPPGNISYKWSTGEVTPTISRPLTVTPGMQEYTLTLSVTVRDNSDGSSRTISKNVLVRDPYNCPTCW